MKQLLEHARRIVLSRRAWLLCAAQVRDGQGAVIERLYREVRGTAIYGGSEEIMLDLAMKRARL